MRDEKYSKKLALGLKISPQEIEHNLALHAASLKVPMAVSYPATWDWRKQPDGDYTTPIRDQAGCGSCVAFAVVGLIESMANIEVKNPKLDKNLAEAYLFPRGGGTCAGGSQFERMLMAAESGVCDEACCLYSGDWTPCPDYKNRLTKISSYGVLRNAAAAKDYISTKGPLVSGMEVYDDFFDYTGGIYRDQGIGSFAGNHAILVIGYNDTEKYWICKNSWGPAFGESGWFRIAYDIFGLGSSFPFYYVNMGGSPGPNPSPDPTPVPSNPDLICPIDGNVSLAMTLKNPTGDPILIFNGKEAGTLMLNTIVPLGKFKKGDALAFDLKGIVHKNQCWPSEWRVYSLRMGNSAYQFRIDIKKM